MRLIYCLIASSVIGLVAACGGGGGLSGTETPPTPPTLPTPSMTLGLRDINNVPTNTVGRDTTTYAQVQLLDETGVAPAPTLVTLSGDGSLIAFSATGLTDGTGVARIPITVVPTSAGGASTLLANATVSASTVSASVDFQVLGGADAGVPALTLGLGGGGNSVPASGLTLARATVTDASGAVVQGKLVTFSGDGALIKLSPASGQVLTDASGVASIQIAPASLLAEGASTLVAQTSVGTTALSTSFEFQLAAANLGLQDLNLGADTLVAFGNRPISVLATIDGAAATNTPVLVSFSASCGTVEPATVTTDASGTASSTYSASLPTCAGTNVTITAAAVGATALSGSVAVASAIATNVQFISTTPGLIYLRDSVGPTQAQVIFKVIDSSGNPLQNKSLRLSLSNTATGVSLDTVGNTLPVELSTDSFGQVTLAVFSGTVPTSLNVKASLVDNAKVFTNSNLLTVAIGRPTQRSLSLAVEKLSIEGGDLDDVTTGVTLSMADRQGNPVPPGTQVNFVAESGVILPPICFVASDSSCSVTLKSQGTRTANGRVSIMAYVTGEEDFVDVNGNNVFDVGESFTDLGRAFRDDNGTSIAGANGKYDTGEFQVPRVGATTCTVASQCPGDRQWGVADVRARATVVFASSSAVVTTSSLIANTPFAGSNPVTNTLTAVTVTVADINGNSTATGSSIVLSTVDDGFQVPGYPLGTLCSVSSTTDHAVANSLAPKVLNVTLRACTAGDQFKVVVTSPTGVTTEEFFTVQ